jgi:hypothetical protein
VNPILWWRRRRAAARVRAILAEAARPIMDEVAAEFAARLGLPPEAVPGLAAALFVYGKAAAARVPVRVRRPEIAEAVAAALLPQWEEELRRTFRRQMVERFGMADLLKDAPAGPLH